MTKMATDELGTRMKQHYEHRCRHQLQRRTYVIVRVDGNAFSTYTKHLHKPFDTAFMEDMDAAARAMCERMAGVKLAYVFSDEISLLLTDIGDIRTEPYFDNDQAKLISLSAAFATAGFNMARMMRRVQVEIDLRPGREDPYAAFEGNTGFFDSRAFTIPDPVEVANYFVWRQRDCIRNSIAMSAQAEFSHRQLQKKNGQDMCQMLSDAGKPWAASPEGFKYGRMIQKVSRLKERTYTDKRDGETKTVVVDRSEWVSVPAPLFTEHRDLLYSRIPLHIPQVEAITEPLENPDDLAVFAEAVIPAYVDDSAGAIRKKFSPR